MLTDSQTPRTALPRTSGACAIVIGAGLGGLAAAMRLGAKGYRVTVIDRLDMPGGRGSSITQGGHRFDLGPTIVTVPQGLRDLWAACGRDFDRDVDLRALEAFYQIQWQDGSTFTARQSTDAMRAEVARLSPSDLPGYDKFLKDSERRYWFGFEDLGRRSMHRFADLLKVLPTFVKMRADKSVYAHAASRVKDERLRFALSFHPLFIGGDPFHVTSMYILVSHLEKEFGVHYAMGGVAAIALAMAGVITSQGGTLRLNAEVDEILLENGRATGVRLTDGEVIAADVVVSNADAGHTYDRLLRNHPRKRWTPTKLARKRWSMGLFVWYFGTKGTRLKWPEAGHHTILVGPRYKDHIRDIFIRGRLADDMSLYVHRPSVTDPSVAPLGDDTFYALSPVPHLGIGSTDWQTEAEPYRQKMQKMLEDRLLPGLGDHLTEQLVFTPNSFQTRYLSPYGSGFSIEPRILQSAYFRPHNVSEEAKGLFLVGAGTHPGAGLPGVIASAEVLGILVPDAPRKPVLRMAAE
ncbi:MAG: phytoene dehydrogenase [Pseudorhodobacter sp. PARRP1]|nr:MAG: phytoene dehydrogenase [Pseudorhodobacter sp. PARRP1]